ncbi:fatty acid synthase alpha subunit Lsd1 [Coemansia sp. RSA 986]|nr:fatty acid synthase alpha subunit Lsd1 [Coemansia sp. RSA 986]
MTLPKEAAALGIISIPSENLTSDIEIHAAFLEHCVNSGLEVASAAFTAFVKKFGILQDANNVYAIISKHHINNDGARLVLRAYYSLWSINSDHYRQILSGKESQASALFSSASTGTIAMFGGHYGDSGSPLDEATWLYDVYSPLLSNYVVSMSAFMASAAKESQVALAHPLGLDVSGWLSKPCSAPDSEYLSQAAVSVPLFGLKQLMRIMVLYKTLGMSPGEFIKQFKAGYGHSHGIVIATAFAMLTDESTFYAVSKKVLGILLLAGALPQTVIPTNSATGSATVNVDVRSTVLVQDVSVDSLKGSVSAFNKLQPADTDCVHLVSVDNCDYHIVAATQGTATCFVDYFRHQGVQDTQADALTSSRSKPALGSLELALRIAKDNRWMLDPRDMHLPVYTSDGTHSICDEPDLTEYLLKSACTSNSGLIQVSASCTNANIVLFGSDKITGFDHLTCKLVEGTGVSVIHANAMLQVPAYPHMGTVSDLYKQRISNISASPDWHSKCSPKLVRTSFDDRMHIDTSMHRILGKPPVTVVGRLTSAAAEVQVKQIADVYNAGYSVEIDGSDMDSDTIAQTLVGLTGQLQPGQGIMLNCNFGNQELWSAQLPTLLRLCKEGIPIAGICIGGAIPQLDAAVSIIGALGAVGIRHVSFKPRDADEILKAVGVAQATNGFPILLQWTRCTNGAPFAFDGFVRPLLETYSMMRLCDSLVLAVEASDTAGCSDALSYITGNWSIRHGRAPMPIDGVLLDSGLFIESRCARSDTETSQQDQAVSMDIANIIDRLYCSLIASVLGSVYASDESRVPNVEYIGNEPCTGILPDSVQVESSATELVFKISSDEILLPEHSVWLQTLGGGRKSWLQQLLSTPVVIQGNRCVPNTTKQVMRPLPGQVVTLCTKDEVVNLVTITNGSDSNPCATIKYCLDSGDITVAAYYQARDARRSIQLEYAYHPEKSFAPIHQHMDRVCNTVRRYYEEFMYTVYGRLDTDGTITGFSEHFHSEEAAVTKQRVRDFCRNVNSCVDFYNDGSDDKWLLPIEFAYFLSFPGTMRALILPAVGNYHFSFVPHHYRIELISEKGEPFCSDSEMQVRHSVDALFNTPVGKQINISSVVHCNGNPVARTSNAILGMRSFTDNPTTFCKTHNQTITARIPTSEAIKSLESKAWFNYNSDSYPHIAPGSLLEFCLDSVCRFKDAGMYSSITTTGPAVLVQATGRRTHVASIGLHVDTPCTSNPAVDFLQQYATNDGSCVFANNGYPIDLPESTDSKPHITVTEALDEFSAISGDYNPVHGNPYYASLKGLPGAVIHGIWVGAAVRAVVDKCALEGNSGRVRVVDFKITGLAFPNEKLTVSIRHVGMKDGRILAQAITTKFDGTPVLACDFEIEQLKTAYIFIGHQEAPVTGVVMSLYDQSNSAKDVWDCAERYMLEEYGISLLDVVRSNPTRMEVKFEGERGSRLLGKYMSLKKDCLQTSPCVLPGLSSDSQNYTFNSPDGVLRLLQFSQLVHAVDAMASVADMRSKGLVQKNSLFAGHSLGELTALASLGCGLLSVEETVAVIFHRGLLIQSVIDDKSQCGLMDTNQTSTTTVGVNSLLHSSKMLPHAEPIRSILQTNIHASNVDVSALQHCYVPNLTGKPFELSKNYIESAYDITQSTVLKQILDRWQTFDISNISDKKRIALELLIEILAFQLANPVQWSSTQQNILSEQKVRRLIEISSNTQRSDMVSAIAKDKANNADNADIMHIKSDREYVYYEKSASFS